MKREKSQKEKAQEAFLSRMAGEQAQRERNATDEATNAFFEALGLTSAQASAVSQFDKKHILDKLLPAWVRLYADERKAAQRVEETHKSVVARVDEISRALMAKLMQSCGDLNAALNEARTDAYEFGYGAALRDTAMVDGYAQLGINTDVQSVREDREAAFPSGKVVRIG